MSTTAYLPPTRTATESSITTRARAVDPADTGAYRPAHHPPTHRATTTVPCSRPFVSITCCATPQEPHTPASRISTATPPITANRP
ncbi:hypothetical protein KMT30_49160, partial [Streptomyces sp. IBSBF 2953]|nr:hypothetical protein [Streptomyces hayashii]